MLIISISISTIDQKAGQLLSLEVTGERIVVWTYTKLHTPGSTSINVALH